MLSRIFLFIAFVMGTWQLPAQTVSLLTNGRTEVNGNLGYWRDTTQTATLEDARHRTFTVANPALAPNIGFDRAAHWFKLEINNTTKSGEWLLEIPYAPLDQIDFYMEVDDRTVVHKTSGDHHPISKHDLSHRHPIFSFNILPGQSGTIYLRIQSISSVQVPITFWHRDAFLKTSYNLQMLNGLFYGGMLLMILYQMFLFLSTRDRITFYYVLTLVAMVNVVAFFQGYSFLYLYPESPGFNDKLAMVTGPFFVICSTLLTRAFLNVRRFSPLLDSLLLGNMAADILLAVLMSIFFRQISYAYHFYLIFVHCLLALISAGYCLQKKYKPARYYLLAWFTLLVAAGIFTLSSVGFTPGYLSTNYIGLMVGSILQMLFISLALGDRWTTLEKENRLAKELEFLREQSEKERLEKEVQLRTNEIQQQNLQLEEVNNVKDKLFSVVSHDIKGPLNSLHLALSLAKSGNLTSQEFKEMSVRLEQRFIQTTEFIDNLLQWAKLQMQGETFEPERLDLIELAEETVHLLEPECIEKGIILNNNLRGTLDAFADLNMMRSVVRNLITNAIKFTKKGGGITLSAYHVDRKIIISVADTGVGIPRSNRERLFTPMSPTTDGTQFEKGTGLGLLLCKQFVEKNGGRIWFESEVGKGTTFYFSLPIYADESFVAKANG